MKSLAVLPGRATVVILALLIPVSLYAGPCEEAGLDVYTQSGFTCTIGGTEFSEFVAALAGVGDLSSSLTLDDVTVKPGGDTTRPAFNFEGPFVADGLLTALSFTVGYTGTGPLTSPFYQTAFFLTDATLSGSLTGTITAAEAVCEGGSFTDPLAAVLVCPAGVGVNLEMNAQISGSNLDGTVILPFTSAVSTFSVVKKLTMTGSDAGPASVTAVGNDTAAIPEPSTALLMGVPIIGLLMHRLRRKAAQECM